MRPVRMQARLYHCISFIASGFAALPAEAQQPQYPYEVDTKPSRGIIPTSEQLSCPLDPIDPVTGQLHIQSLPEYSLHLSGRSCDCRGGAMRREKVRRGDIMRSRTLLRIGLFTSLLLVLGNWAAAQGRNAAERKSDFSRLPSDLQRQVTALGGRVKTAGQEQTVLAGQFVDGSGKPLSARVVHQRSGEVVLEGFKDKKTVNFDGRNSAGETDRTDESLLETFVMDTPEGMFASLQAGAAMRLLGRDFGPDPRVDPGYTGPRYDIYEVAAPTRTRRDEMLRVKRYYFDSATGLLISTRYEDPTVGRGLKVETRFSEWRTMDGSQYPGRVDRYEDGRLVFSFAVATASSGPKAAAALSR